MTTPMEGASQGAGDLSRLVFVDHLRVALTVQVVLHHISIVYAANTSFYYLERPTHGTFGLAMLVLFQLLNQGYFMGFFFLISGYLSPASMDRKGPAGFVKSRMTRLGIPILIFAFILGPLAKVGYYLMPSSFTGITTPYDLDQYLHIGLGPMWFAAVLLIFDLGYAALVSYARRRPTTASEPRPLPGPATVLAFVALVAVTSFIVRIIDPIGVVTPVLNMQSAGYLPQYLGFFVIGAVAFRSGWLARLSDRAGRWGLAVAAVVTVVVLPFAFGGGAQFAGGLNIHAALYSIWDSVYSVGMCLGGIVVFRRLFDKSGRLRQYLSRHAFLVYVIHPVVIVFVAYALRDVPGVPLAKFALLSVLVLPLLFALAGVLRRIPLADCVF